MTSETRYRVFHIPGNAIKSDALAAVQGALGGVVWNEEAWKSIKAGNLKGYSLQGVARKEAFS